MCGIAGLVYETREGGSFSWDDFDAHLNKVLTMSLEGSADSEVLSELESLFEKVQFLKEFSSGAFSIFLKDLAWARLRRQPIRGSFQSLENGCCEAD